MRRIVSTGLAAGLGAGILWVLWQMKDVFPGEFELHMTAAIVTTFIVIWVAMGQDNSAPAPDNRVL